MCVCVHVCVCVFYADDVLHLSQSINAMHQTLVISLHWNLTTGLTQQNQPQQVTVDKMTGGDIRYAVHLPGPVPLVSLSSFPSCLEAVPRHIVAAACLLHSCAVEECSFCVVVAGLVHPRTPRLALNNTTHRSNSHSPHKPTTYVHLTAFFENNLGKPAPER